MKRTILGAALLAAGCVQTTDRSALDYWGEHPGVIGSRKKPKQDLQAAWRGETNPWAVMKGMKGVPGNVIGGRSGFEKRKAAPRALAAASAGTIAVPGIATGKTGGVPGLSREIQVLASRVDKLEHMATSGRASGGASFSGSTTARVVAPVPQKAPGIAIYKVHPSGRTAWIAAGSSSGIREGQSFRVARGGTAVAEVKVARVWPKVTELSILWANGKLQRGDAVMMSR